MSLQAILPWLRIQDGCYYLGKYRLIHELGRGGMGVVFLGVDEEQIPQQAGACLVAIKCLIPPDASSPDDPDYQASLVWFRREITRSQTLRIGHHRIVAYYESGELPPLVTSHVEKLHWFAMDYVPGRTLRQVLDTWTRLPQSMAVSIACQICEGLVELHGNDERAGLIHRDLKPANICLDARSKQNVVLLDFGIAKDVTQYTAGPIVHSRFCGTRFYAAPERCDWPARSSFQSDLWSLGVILHEMLTGRNPVSPLPGSTVLDLRDPKVFKKYMYAFAPEAHSPDKCVKELDRDLCLLIVKLMARDPEYRPASAQETLSELQNCLERAKYQPVHISDHWYSLLTPIRQAVREYADTFNQNSHIPFSEGDRFVCGMSRVNENLRMFLHEFENLAEKLHTFSLNDVPRTINLLVGETDVDSDLARQELSVLVKTLSDILSSFDEQFRIFQSVLNFKLNSEFSQSYGATRLLITQELRAAIAVLKPVDLTQASASELLNQVKAKILVCWSNLRNLPPIVRKTQDSVSDAYAVFVEYALWRA